MSHLEVVFTFHLLLLPLCFLSISISFAGGSSLATYVSTHIPGTEDRMQWNTPNQAYRRRWAVEQHKPQFHTEDSVNQHTPASHLGCSEPKYTPASHEGCSETTYTPASQIGCSGQIAQLQTTRCFINSVDKHNGSPQCCCAVIICEQMTR